MDFTFNRVQLKVVAVIIHVVIQRYLIIQKFLTSQLLSLKYLNNPSLNPVSSLYYCSVRVNEIRFRSLLIFFLSVASISRKWLKTTHAKERQKIFL